MSVDHLRYSEEITTGISDMPALVVAAATELASPLVLLRQLGFSLQAGDLSDQEHQRLLDQITLTSERALRLTTSLAMSAQGQTALPLEPVNPVTVCQEVVHELSPLLRAHGQKVMVGSSRAHASLSVANHTALCRVVMGLVDNALHYGAPEHPIQLLITRRRDRIRIGVRDYGPAVSINIWEKLEENVAKRARVPLATRPQASVVNLLVARRLASLMGSAMGVVRHRNGATFYIDLQLSGQMSLL